MICKCTCDYSKLILFIASRAIVAARGSISRESSGNTPAKVCTFCIRSILDVTYLDWSSWISISFERSMKLLCKLTFCMIFLFLYIKDPYNVSQEIERKRALSMVLSQTKQQERKDAEVLILLI